MFLLTCPAIMPLPLGTDRTASLHCPRHIEIPVSGNNTHRSYGLMGCSDVGRKRGMVAEGLDRCEGSAVGDAWMPAAGYVRALDDGGQMKGGAPRVVWMTLGADPQQIS